MKTFFALALLIASAAALTACKQQPAEAPVVAQEPAAPVEASPVPAEETNPAEAEGQAPATEQGK